ncbi:MAG: Bug family tripartite tricarboxylate transporter substrate binding protein [Nocardioidaceae bacterium]
MKQLRPTLPRQATGAAAIALSLVLVGCSAGTQDKASEKMPEDVEVVIPYSTGGGTDLWTRFMAPHLEDRLKGTSFSLRNAAGGEGIPAVNEFARDAKDDPSTILAATATTVFQDFFDRPEVEFDFRELKPLVLNGSGAVVYTTKDSGITSVEDLVERSDDLAFGGSSANGLDLTLLLLFELYGLKGVETVFGFESRGDIQLAVQRGELNIDFQTTAAYQAQVAPLAEDGSVVPLMSMGAVDDKGELVRDPNFPDLPHPGEVYEQLRGEKPSGPGWEAFRTFQAAGFAYTKGLWAGPDVPDSITQQYYDAATELQEDEAFQKEAEEVLGGYPIYAGDEAEDAIKEIFSIDEDAKAYVVDLLTEKYDVDLGQ